MGIRFSGRRVRLICQPDPRPRIKDTLVPGCFFNSSLDPFFSPFILLHGPHRASASTGSTFPCIPPPNRKEKRKTSARSPALIRSTPPQHPSRTPVHLWVYP